MCDLLRNRETIYSHERFDWKNMQDTNPNPNPKRRKRARSALAMDTSTPRTISTGVPDVMHFNTGAMVRAGPHREVVRHKLLSALYEKSDFLDVATVLGRQYDVDHTNPGINIHDTAARLGPQKKAQRLQQSKFIRDNSFVKHWVDHCEGSELRPLRLNSQRQQSSFRWLMADSGSAPTTISTLLHRNSRITGNPTWPVKWTSCGTTQHYHTFSASERPIDYAADPPPSFPEEWLAPTKRVRHSIARAEEGELTWEDDLVVCQQQAKEPFRPVPLAVRRLVASQLQQQIDSSEIPVLRSAEKRNPLLEIASKLTVEEEQERQNCTCCEVQRESGDLPRPPWEPENLMQSHQAKPSSTRTGEDRVPARGRCLHMQALETTLGRHTEGVVDSVLHLVLSNLQGYASTVRKHTSEQNAKEATSVIQGTEGPTKYVSSNLRQKLRNNIHHVMGQFDAERSDGVFTWEHVLMMLQQQIEHATEGSSESVDVHPLLHPLKINAATMQRIRNRVMLLCADPAMNTSNFEKFHAAPTTMRYVDEMIKEVDAGHHLDCLHITPTRRMPATRSASTYVDANMTSDHDAADDGEEVPEQEIIVQLADG